MDEAKSMTFKEFKDKIRGLRSTINYDDELDNIQNYLGLPTNNEDDIPMESLLIGVTKICFKSSKIKADAVLAALGLLEGYNNRCGNQKLSEEETRELLTERRIQFLQESVYLEITKVKGTLYHSYENLINDKTADEKGKTAFETALSTLGSKDGRFLNVIAEKLYNNRKNLQKYIEKGRLYLDKSGKNVKLPPLSSRRKMPVIASQPEETTIDLDTERGNQHSGKTGLYTTLTTPDDITITITGPKSAKTEKIMAAIYKFAAEELITVSFLCIVLVISIAGYVQNYDRFTEKPSLSFSMDALEERVVERDPDKVVLYYKILAVYIALIIICLIVMIVLLRIITKRRRLKQSTKKKE